MKRLILVALLFPLVAFAQETERPAPKTMAELYPPLPGVEYFCTDSYGARVELGQISCFTASCQTWMARCEMVSQGNMAMWRKVQDGCPGVGLLQRLQRARPRV